MDPVSLLILINCAIFAVPYITSFDGPFQDSFNNFLSLGWVSARDISNGEYYRIVTSSFLHADLMHLFVNMYSLYNVGASVRFLWGNGGFFLIYILSGIIAAITSFMLGRGPSVGASGAIFGLVGALLSYAIINNQPGMLQQIIIVIAINALIGFLPGSRIDNFGHLGGLIAGIVIGFVLPRR
jgi:rhomboid protease GluP